ncbi:uncharacterized protein LOC144343220 [Saccoglossus kowalevskii]
MGCCFDREGGASYHSDVGHDDSEEATVKQPARGVTHRKVSGHRGPSVSSSSGSEDRALNSDRQNREDYNSFQIRNNDTETTSGQVDKDDNVQGTINTRIDDKNRKRRLRVGLDNGQRERLYRDKERAKSDGVILTNKMGGTENSAMWFANQNNEDTNDETNDDVDTDIDAIVHVTKRPDTGSIASSNVSFTDGRYGSVSSVSTMDGDKAKPKKKKKMWNKIKKKIRKNKKK